MADQQLSISDSQPLPAAGLGIANSEPLPEQTPSAFWNGVKEAARNLPSSALRAIQNIPRPGLGAPNLRVDPQNKQLIDGDTGKPWAPDPVEEVKGWWNNIKQRYGSYDQALETAKKDPAGVALDLALLTRGAVGAGEAGLATPPGQAVARAADAAATGVTAAAPDVLKGAAKTAGGAAATVAAEHFGGPAVGIATALGTKTLVKNGLRQMGAGLVSGRDAVIARLQALKEQAAAAEAPPMAGVVDMPHPAAADFSWPTEMGGPELPTGVMSRRLPKALPEASGQPITPDTSAIAAAKALSDELGVDTSKVAAKPASPDFEAIARQKKATALAHVLDEAGISHQDLAMLPLKEQQQHLGALVKELKLNQTGQISPESIDQTLFELRKLQKAAQPAAAQ